jgi:hypothetical protein
MTDTGKFAIDRERARDVVTAPFTAKQVEWLWHYQFHSRMHPFTCGNRSRGTHPGIGGDYGILIPTVRGWVCMFCDYTQDWAHAFMAEPP